MRKAVLAFFLLGLILSFGPGPAGADENASHGGPVVPVLLGLVLILAAAKLGGELFERWAS